MFRYIRSNYMYENIHIKTSRREFDLQFHWNWFYRKYRKMFSHIVEEKNNELFKFLFYIFSDHQRIRPRTVPILKRDNFQVAAALRRMSFLSLILLYGKDKYEVSQLMKILSISEMQPGHLFILMDSTKFFIWLCSLSIINNHDHSHKRTVH